MRILALALLLSACSTDIKLTYYTDACYDWDFNTLNRSFALNATVRT
jgi:hypothetical protein